MLLRKKLLHQHETTRLFWNKYCYKIGWSSELGNYYRGGDLLKVRTLLDDLQHQWSTNGAMFIKHRTFYKDYQPSWTKVSLKELHLNQILYKALTLNNDWRIRVSYGLENYNVQIYSNHRDWLFKLGTQINADSWWEPKSKLTTNSIKMTSAMKGWAYRITLRGKPTTDFINWMKTNADKLKFGSQFKKELDDPRPYLSGMYFYVSGDRMLNLAILVSSDNIMRIDKIVIDNQNA